MRRYALVALLLAVLMVPAGVGAADAPPSPTEQRAARLKELLEFKGSPEEELAKCRSALPIAEELIATEPDKPRWRREWFGVHGCIGFSLLDLGERDAALRHFRTVMDFNARLFASGDAELADKFFTSQTALAYALADSGELEIALEVFQTAIDFQIRKAEDDPEDAYVRWSLLNLYKEIGEVQEKAGAPDEALASYREGIDLIERLGPGTRDPDDVVELTMVRAETHGRIAGLLRTRGDLEGTLRNRELEIDNYRTAWLAYPGNAVLAIKTLVTGHRIAGLWRDMGDPDYALEILQNHLEVVEPMAKEVPFYELRELLADLHADIGRIHREQGNLEDALKSFQACVAVRKRKSHDDSSDLQWQRKTALAYADLGDVQDALDDASGATKSYRAAAKIQARLLAKQWDNETWRQDLKKWKAFIPQRYKR